MNHAPLVSVIVANYNYGHFLRECIDSVLAQRYQPVELIVVDDGSTDDSRNVLDSYGTRIKTVLQNNQGQGAAFGNGYAHARGEVICLLDADDGWYPDKLERVVAVFQQHPDVQWVRHKFDVVGERLEPMNSVVPAYTRSGVVHPEAAQVVEGQLRAGTSLVMRRALADKVLPAPIPPELALDADDTIIFARVVKQRAPGYSVDAALGFYRRHGGTRFNSVDLQRSLQREAALSAALGEYFGLGTPTSSYKLAAVVAALEQQPFWHAQRLGNYGRGLLSALRFWSRPGMLGRQLGALTLAYVAPNLWVRQMLARGVPAGNSDQAQP